MGIIQSTIRTRGSGPVTFVAGAANGSVVDVSSAFDVSLPGGLQSGDCVVVCVGAATIPDRNVTINTAGYTEVGDYFQLSSDTLQGANLAIFYKFMGGTPDSVVNVQGLSASAETIVCIGAYRNVDPATPIDVSPITEGVDFLYGLATSSITPATVGAMALFAGKGAAFYDTGSVSTTLAVSSWTMAASRQVNASSRVGGLALMHRPWVSGTFGVQSLAQTYAFGTSPCSMRATLALRPKP